MVFTTATFTIQTNHEGCIVNRTKFSYEMLGLPQLPILLANDNIVAVRNDLAVFEQ